MRKKLEVFDPQSVSALANLCRGHPEAGIKWDLKDPNKVVVTGQEALGMKVDGGRLTRLELSNDMLEGVLSLRGMPGLSHLKVSCPRVTKVTVDDMPDLTTLTLDNLLLEKYRDSLSLGDLPKLTSLRVTRCGLDDLKPLGHLVGLKSLDLGANRVKSLSPLAGLANLTKLILSSNAIVDVSPLAGLGSLKEIDLSGNSLPSLGDLARISSLRILSANDNPLAGGETLGAFTRLHTLRLCGVGLGALVGLGELRKLQGLELRENDIEDLGFLSGLTALRYLDLSDNKVKSLEGLKNNVDIRRLNLSNNQISDITPLRFLKRLTELNLAYNLVDDLIGLCMLPLLEDLDLRSNKILSIEPLRSLPRLTKVNLSNNSYLDEEVMEGLLTDLEAALNKAFVEEYRRNGGIEGAISRMGKLPEDPKLRAQLYVNFFGRMLADEMIEYNRNLQKAQAAASEREAKDKAARGEGAEGSGDEDPDNARLVSELRRLLGDDGTSDLGELIAKACEPNPDEPPDEGVVYDSLDEVEGLPQELLDILRQLGGEPTMVKVKTVKRGVSGGGGLPDLPKGTIVIRCQVEATPGEGRGEDDQGEGIGDDQGGRHPFRGPAGPPANGRFPHGADPTFPFIRRKTGPGNTLSRRDQEEYNDMERRFFLLSYNPAKFSLH
ncbi:MAG: leucine-rich repeat domain-containing protein [Deltaproteobacteria bacterium]|jgi:internalin A|nr:leucine-rich repeat domain-containing protein [Deltaproteobacteria bacterium]